MARQKTPEQATRELKKVAEMVRIHRPKKIEVEIFDEKHQLKRLNRGVVTDILLVVMENYASLGSQLRNILTAPMDAKKQIIFSVGEIVDIVLKRSFPTFKEWEEIDLDGELQLLEVVWKDGRLGEILKGFFKKIPPEIIERLSEESPEGTNKD